MPDAISMSDNEFVANKLQLSHCKYVAKFAGAWSVLLVNHVCVGVEPIGMVTQQLQDRKFQPKTQVQTSSINCLS